jgi:hypothetical protein
MEQILDSRQIPFDSPSPRPPLPLRPPRSSRPPRPPQPDDDPDHPIKTLYCARCEHPLRVKLSCKDRTCPSCRKKWYGYHYGALRQHISSWKKVYFLTLTLKNIPDSQISRWHIQRLREAFSKLRYRLRPSIKDGYYVIQTTNSGTGWHLHVHVLFNGNYIAASRISQAWRDITKDSYIVDIKLVEKWDIALRYLLSDFRGKPRIRPEDHWTYNGLFRRSRLVQGFGAYSKIKLRVPYRCPICGESCWILLDALFSDRVRTWPSKYEDDS